MGLDLLSFALADAKFALDPLKGRDVACLGSGEDPLGLGQQAGRLSLKEVATGHTDSSATVMPALSP
jgi:hypothetical protein